MRQSRIVVLVLIGVAVAVVAFAACSGDGGDDETSSSGSDRSTPGCRPVDDSSEQRMTVQPCTDLVDGQSVKVYAAAFTPGVQIAVTVCAADSDPGDSDSRRARCDPNDVTTVEVGAGGSVVVDFAVKKVLASKDPIDCTATPCVLTVGELDGDERADPVAITFAP